jgi:hypothetical protein
MPAQPKVTKTLCPDVRPSLRLGFLRSGIDPGFSAYGLLRCTSSRCVWLRQTVAALPHPDQSLHSACRWAPRSRSRSKAGELTLGLLSGEERGAHGFLICVGFAPHPSPLPRERGPIRGLFKICVRLGIASRRISTNPRDQSPLPPGEG